MMWHNGIFLLMCHNPQVPNLILFRITHFHFHALFYMLQCSLPSHRPPIFNFLQYFFHFFIRYANATALNRCTKKVRTPTGQDEGCPYTGKLPGHLFSAPPNDPEVNPWVKFQNLRSPLTHQFSILFKKTLHYFFINVL